MYLNLSLFYAPVIFPWHPISSMGMGMDDKFSFPNPCVALPCGDNLMIITLLLAYATQQDSHRGKGPNVLSWAIPQHWGQSKSNCTAPYFRPDYMALVGFWLATLREIEGS